MIVVELYTKENCPLCDEAEEALQELMKTYSLKIKKIDIYKDDSLLELYQIRIPVIKIKGDVIAEGIVRKDEVEKTLRGLLQT